MRCVGEPRILFFVKRARVCVFLWPSSGKRRVMQRTTERCEIHANLRHFLHNHAVEASCSSPSDGGYEDSCADRIDSSHRNDDQAPRDEDATTYDELKGTYSEGRVDQIEAFHPTIVNHTIAQHNVTKRDETTKTEFVAFCLRIASRFFALTTTDGAAVRARD